MFDQYGPINEILLSLHIINQRINFFGVVGTARLTVILVDLWIGIPYSMLITSGILINIPADLYEAAQIDGSKVYQTFFRITLPYIMFICAPYLITSFIGNMNNFNVIFLLTGGGPMSSNYISAGKTDLLVTWLYRLTADVKDYNLASAVGIASFILCAVVSLLTYVKISKKNTGDFS